MDRCGSSSVSASLHCKRGAMATRTSLYLSYRGLGVVSPEKSNSGSEYRHYSPQVVVGVVTFPYNKNTNTLIMRPFRGSRRVLLRTLVFTCQIGLSPHDCVWILQGPDSSLPNPVRYGFRISALLSSGLRRGSSISF